MKRKDVIKYLKEIKGYLDEDPGDTVYGQGWDDGANFVIRNALSRLEGKK